MSSNVCGFHSHCFDDQWDWELFCLLIGHLHAFLCESSVKLKKKFYWSIVDLQFFFSNFSPFNWLFCSFPPPKIVGILYMFCRQNSSSDICVMNIVFQSVSCLFIFLTMSFDGWMLKFWGSPICHFLNFVAGNFWAPIKKSLPVNGLMKTFSYIVF